MRARTRRLREQKWLLDIVISTVGLDWDLLRMGMATAPVGFEAMGDWSQVVAKAKRFDEITPSFTEIAALREMRAREAEQAATRLRRENLISSHQSITGSLSGRSTRFRNNLALNAKKLECYSHYAKRAHHKIERVEIRMGPRT